MLLFTYKTQPFFSLFIWASREWLFTLHNCGSWSEISERHNNPKPLSELPASCFKSHQNLLVLLICWTRHPICLLKQLPGCYVVSIICLLIMTSVCPLLYQTENSCALALLEWADSFPAVVDEGFSVQHNMKSWWTVQNFNENSETLFKYYTFSDFFFFFCFPLTPHSKYRSIPGSHGFESLYFILGDYKYWYNEFMGFDVIKILNHNCW